MKMNDFEKMQQNLQQMKENLEKIQPTNKVVEPKKLKVRGGRRVANNRIKRTKISVIKREEQIIVMITIAIVAITFIFSTSIFAKTMSENVTTDESENSVEITEDTEEEEETEEIEESEEVAQAQTEDQNQEDTSNEGQAETSAVPEKNENAIELEEILLENVSVLKSKEYVEEERAIEFETEYQENANLPEGEEVVVQQGIDGTQQVSVIKTYENNVLVSEDILESEVIEDYVVEIVDVGTSQFLGSNKVHLGDTMYVTKDVSLMLEPSDDSEEVTTILQSLDVTLEELAGEEWCKIEYDGVEGYVKCKNLTSSKVTPGIVEANRIQRIKMTLSEDMALNCSTDLTLEDYTKILSGNSQDTNNVIAESAEAFYLVDKTYNINGVFLAAMAIHESAWGTSTIAQEKKNLFGYGAYDSSPYESAYTFETYAEGIELLAKVMVKYYINEEGTEIYDDELAKGSYYNGPTIADVNIRYASDSQWHNKIYTYMEYLYNRL